MISPFFIGTGSAITAGVSAIHSLINKRNNDKMYDYQHNAYRYTYE